MRCFHFCSIWLSAQQKKVRVTGILSDCSSFLCGFVNFISLKLLI
jgi:hypothetical protein